MLAASRGVARVTAVEPSPIVLPTLIRNVALNGLPPRVQVVAAAISDQLARVSFWVNRQEHNLSTGSVLPEAQSLDRVRVDVPSHTGDSILSTIVG